MRYAAVFVLILCQFTALPFLAMVAANTARQGTPADEYAADQAANLNNVTTVYKAVAM